MKVKLWIERGSLGRCYNLHFNTVRACFGGADEDAAAVSSRNMGGGGGGGAAAKSDLEEVAAPKEESHKKEQSVLQAKLTKLAIQIGYAGEPAFVFGVEYF